jgi:hypothetical protein
MGDTYISADMAGAVGCLLGRQVSFPIAESDIRKWSLAVYYPEKPPRPFWDASYAATTPHGGIVAIANPSSRGRTGFRRRCPSISRTGGTGTWGPS